MTAEELARQIKNGPAKVIVCCEKTVGVAEKAAQLCGLGVDKVLLLKSRNAPGGEQKEDSLRDVKKSGPEILKDGGGEMDWKKITDSRLLKTACILLLYSSGTTGVPKGECLHMHRDHSLRGNTIRGPTYPL
jgi:4-coumarate--CoA ligase